MAPKSLFGGHGRGAEKKEEETSIGASSDDGNEFEINWK